MSGPRVQPVVKQSESLEAAWKRTVARLASIQSHLDTAPRSGKLKGKVCIITGVGSMKGMGYVAFLATHTVLLIMVVGSRRATSLLFAHEGASHNLFPPITSV